MAQAAKPRHSDAVFYGFTDFNQNEARNLRLHQLGADPATPVNGQVLYRTDTHKVRARINGVWRDLATMDDVTAAGISANLIDAKGDLLVGTADNAVDRLPVGTNGQILTADSAEATGVKWAAAPATYTNEQAQDAVGTILTDSATVDFTYDDTANTITAIVTDTSITNAKLATMAANTLKGNNTAGAAAPADLTPTQVKTMLAISSGDVSGLGALATKSTVATADIDNDSVTYAKIQNVSAAARVLGRGSAAGAGDAEELTATGGVEVSGTTIRTTAFTGDVTKAAGGTATTIANDVVTNAKMANMAANTLKGNNTAGTADPVDLTAAQAKAMLAIQSTDISNFSTAVTAHRLDQFAAPTSAVNLNNQKITGLADGTAATDAATFGQISALQSAQKWKDPVDAATTANITLSGTQTIDGVAVAVGDRVLVKNQTTAADNGIYVVAAGAWTRATDADTATELTDATVLVDAGTVNKGDIYTFPAITTLGTTAATPVQTGEGNTVYTASGGVELVGQDFRISTAAAGNGLTGGGGSALAVNPGTGLEIVSDAVRIAAAAAGNGLTGGAGSALAVGAGTGITVTADQVAVDFTIVQRKTAGALTGGTNSEVLTHNLNTRDINKVTLVNSVTPYDAIDDFYWEATTVNTVTIYAGSGYTLPTGYRWNVTG